MLLPILLLANIINIPMDYATIQEGIDLSVTGDTVLVHPGTYLENIEFSNKSNVTLCTLEATTGDTTYIADTIIDGSNEENSTILCYENLTNCTIRGFSITGGRGYIYWDSDDIDSWQVFGGGLFLHNSIELDLMNLNIYNNQASQGGGICFAFENVACTMSNINVYNNIGRFIGGGVCFMSNSTDYSQIIFDQYNRCSIFNNYSPQGMDIGWCFTHGFALDIYLDMFTWYEPTSYYVNTYSQVGDYPFPVFDIERTFISPIENDLYVSMSGDDTNSGLTPENPLRTTWKAFQQLNPSDDNPLTVHLLEGDFFEEINGQGVSIVLKENTILQGTSPNLTHVFAEDFVDTPVSGAVSFGSNQNNMLIKDLSVTSLNAPAICSYATNNSTINNAIVENSETNYGILNFNSNETNIEIKNTILRNNFARWGTIVKAYIESIKMSNVTMTNNIAGSIPIQDVAQACGLYDIYARNSIHIINSKFINNEHNGLGGYATFRHFTLTTSPTLLIDSCLYANNYTSQAPSVFDIFGGFSNVSIVNSTFANNSGSDNSYFMIDDSIDRFYNNIVVNNTGFNFDFYCFRGTNINFNLFSRTEDIYQVYQDEPIDFGSDNLIGTDPLFVGGDPAFPEYYYLSGDDTEVGPSPAIDAGTMDLSLFPANYEFPLYDLAGEDRIYGSSIDIGCYEFPGYTNAQDNVTSLEPYSLANYPNPFNPTTNISFTIPVKSKVEIAIYNVKGQRIRTLSDEEMEIGEHRIVWNGKDEDNRTVSSGIYFCKMKSTDKSFTTKMVLMK